VQQQACPHARPASDRTVEEVSTGSQGPTADSEECQRQRPGARPSHVEPGDARQQHAAGPDDEHREPTKRDQADGGEHARVGQALDRQVQRAAGE
jgi:hypothetical protein